MLKDEPKKVKLLFLRKTSTISLIDVKNRLPDIAELPKPSRRTTDIIRQKRLRDTLMKFIRSKDVTDNTVEVVGDALDDLDLTGSYILANIENDLKAKGLYKDKSDEVLHSDLFKEELTDVPKEISSKLYDRGTFLTDDDITRDDQLGDLGAKDLFPRMSASSFYEHMRPAPKSLEHQIARKLADGDFFEGSEAHQDLYRAAVLFSRHVETEEQFIDVLLGGFYGVCVDYYFQHYQWDQIALKRLIRAEIKKFFSKNRVIQKVLKPESDPNIWGRFQKVWSNLTPKQRHALEKLYMQDSATTLEEAAKDFGISVDSLRDRVKGAVLKFKNEFPEFLNLRNDRRSVDLSSDLSLNGLYRTSNSKEVQPLKIRNFVTGEQKFIEAPSSRTRLKKLTPRQIAEIKAHAIECTPVPNILQTDYFCGLKPQTSQKEKDVSEAKDEPEDQET